MLQVFTPHRYKDTLYRELRKREGERKGKKEREGEKKHFRTVGYTHEAAATTIYSHKRTWPELHFMAHSPLCWPTVRPTVRLPYSHTHISFTFPIFHSRIKRVPNAFPPNGGKLYEFLCQVQFEVAATAVVAPFCCMLFANALQFASNTPCHSPLPLGCLLLIDGSSCAAEQNPFGTRLICGQAATAPKEVAKKITGRKREKGWGSKQ